MYRGYTKRCKPLIRSRNREARLELPDIRRLATKCSVAHINYFHRMECGKRKHLFMIKHTSSLVKYGGGSMAASGTDSLMIAAQYNYKSTERFCLNLQRNASSLTGRTPSWNNTLGLMQ